MKYNKVRKSKKEKPSVTPKLVSVEQTKKECITDGLL